jgi:hypothetical protein
MALDARPSGPGEREFAGESVLGPPRVVAGVAASNQSPRKARDCKYYSIVHKSPLGRSELTTDVSCPYRSQAFDRFVENGRARTIRPKRGRANKLATSGLPMLRQAPTHCYAHANWQSHGLSFVTHRRVATTKCIPTLLVP